MSDKETELFKFKLKLVEILIDKFVIALILVAIAVVADRRLTTYEKNLDLKLDQLREVYQFERVLAKNEIEAYEEIWSKIAAFRRLTNSFENTKVNPEKISMLREENLDLVKTIESNEIYIKRQTMKVIESFAEKDIESFLENWYLDNDTVLSVKTWQSFADATDTVLDRIKEDIYAKKPLVKNLDIEK